MLLDPHWPERFCVLGPQLLYQTPNLCKSIEPSHITLLTKSTVIGPWGCAYIVGFPGTLQQEPGQGLAYP